MSFFKKVVNGLFNGSKEKNEEHSNEEYSPTLIKEAPLAYWEEFSYMLALTPENYTISEDTFANIKAIDGVEIKEKIMPSEDLPGKLVISYDGMDFEVGFYIGDFYTEEMYQWQLQYFTEEEKEEILKVNKALNVYMKFSGNPKKCYHLQLKLIYAMIPEIVALCDESAERMLNKKWVELAVKSNVLPAPISLYTVQAVYDENEVWLHTHGLCRCNLHEIEFLDSNKDDSRTHYDLISNYACRLLDENNPVEEDDGNEIGEETINMGVFYDGEPIVATSKKWINALKYYPKDILGGIEDRKDSHNSKTNILFLYGSEEDFNKKRLRKPSEFTEKLENNPIFYLSNEETARMSSLARERFSYVERMLKEKQDGKDIGIIIKLGLETVDEEGNLDSENREHIWFEALSMEGDSFKARLTQEPYNIPNLHEGDEGIYSIDYVSDWRIHTENGVITPETVYLLDL
ncbi:DUF4026 domain-containing protein [Parvimonas sp. C2]|uniref:DUF4026 domain-containing protein n=1 Tax=Parvimonas sp. C2 TaxID=3110692 RepID=UPI002B4A292F|nr:DUF4026 domain-containing protein [Parvimonas sp. C2]MEB3073565.1 DUF4026 domain-containing protein [Parvimonas sp. C2]